MESGHRTAQSLHQRPVHTPHIRTHDWYGSTAPQRDRTVLSLPLPLLPNVSTRDSGQNYVMKCEYWYARTHALALRNFGGNTQVNVKVLLHSCSVWCHWWMTGYKSDLLWVRRPWSVRIRSEMMIGWVQWCTQTKHKRQSRGSDELAIEVTVQVHSCILCHYPEPGDQRKNPPVQKGVRDTTPWSPSLEIWVCLAVASASADLACVVWSAAILTWSFCVHKHYSISPGEKKNENVDNNVHWCIAH